MKPTLTEEGSGGQSGRPIITPLGDALVCGAVGRGYRSSWVAIGAD